MHILLQALYVCRKRHDTSLLMENDCAFYPGLLWGVRKLWKSSMKVFEKEIIIQGRSILGINDRTLVLNKMDIRFIWHKEDKLGPLRNILWTPFQVLHFPDGRKRFFRRFFWFEHLLLIETEKEYIFCLMPVSSLYRMEVFNGRYNPWKGTNAQEGYLVPDDSGCCTGRERR